MDFKFDINKIESDYRAKIATLEERYLQIPQRQLKFRIWDKWDERFVDNDVSFHCFPQWMIDAETGKAYNVIGAIDGDHSDNDQRNLYRDHERFSGPDGAYIIQQFTGLKDKNGTDIFEGDIISDSEGIIGTVHFGEYSTGKDDWGLPYITTGFYIDYIDGGKAGIHNYGKSSYGFYAKNINVIGNILENEVSPDGKELYKLATR